MDLVSWFIFFFAAVRLLVAFYNWISSPFLPEVKGDISLSDLSILIPVRNEERNLPFLLEDLFKLHPQPLEILFYDDLSTDRTSELIEDASRKCPRIKLLKGGLLPDGWMGKNYACHQLAKGAQGDYFLFIDADVRIQPCFPARILSYMKEKKLKLLSLFPTQIMARIGVRLSVPLMNWILLSLLPLRLVRLLPHTSLAAANGQCMLFEYTTYNFLQPHKTVKKDPVEDMAIMRLYKQKVLPVAVLLGRNDISCCMYDNLKESITGFSKNIFRFFGGSALLAFSFGIITTFGLVWIILNTNRVVVFLYLLFMLLIRIFVSLSSHQNLFLNLLFIIPQQVVFWFILVNAFIHKKQNKIIWKERSIPFSSTSV